MTPQEMHRDRDGTKNGTPEGRFQVILARGTPNHIGQTNLARSPIVNTRWPYSLLGCIYTAGDTPSAMETRTGSNNGESLC